ncbi:MAG: sulfite exporter TauE/SafE family protein [Deltaproteobacteria bacterium]|nr:sulfite exporter TauE/SafE family protein [Deltaproteobacteria bacterium]
MTQSLLLLLTVLGTSTLSGVFGMAGGLVLMGALLLQLPVPQAMVAHGILQLAANGSRAALLARHVRWPILATYAVGALLAVAALQVVQVAPSKPWVYLALGIVPALAWLPAQRLRLDAARPTHAAACGAAVTAMHIAAGASGPLLDLFFARTSLDRHTIVATKAATQVLAHAVKVLFYLWLLGSARQEAWLDWRWLAAGAVVSLAGTWLGGRVLNRMTDRSFLRWTRWLITAIGAVYLAQAARMFAE